MLYGELRLRWIHGACYEIALPNGRVIVTDPWIHPHHFESFGTDDVTGADYILISHAHFDHLTDVPQLLKRYGGRLFIGAMSAVPVAKMFDLSYNDIYPVYPGQRFEFEDMEIDTIWGKHGRVSTPDAHIPSAMHPMYMDDFGTAYYECHHPGTIEMINYMLTLNNNLRLFFSSGGNDELLSNFAEIERFRPNVIIRHFGKKDTPEAFAEYCHRTRAQLVLPHHHEGLGAERAAEELCQVNRILEEKGSCTRVLDPEKFHWYSLGMQLTAL